MSPMLLTGAGWLLSTLGAGGLLGTLGVPAAILGFGVLGYGLQQIRWRSDWFGHAFWLAVVSLVLWLVVIFGLYVDRSLFYTLILAQAAIAFTLSRGVRGCIPASTPPAGRLRALSVASVVIAATTVAIVLADIVVTAGAELPSTPLAALLFVSGLTGIVFGGLLLTLNREPALQAHS